MQSLCIVSLAPRWSLCFLLSFPNINGLSHISRFPDGCHVCMLFVLGRRNVVLPPFPKRFACPIRIPRMPHSFIAILRWWSCFGCGFLTVVKFRCLRATSGFRGRIVGVRILLRIDVGLLIHRLQRIVAVGLRLLHLRFGGYVHLDRRCFVNAPTWTILQMSATRPLIVSRVRSSSAAAASSSQPSSASACGRAASAAPALRSAPGTGASTAPSGRPRDQSVRPSFGFLRTAGSFAPRSPSSAAVRPSQPTKGTEGPRGGASVPLIGCASRSSSSQRATGWPLTFACWPEITRQENPIEAGLR